MEYSNEYTNYQVNRSGLRYFIRDFYLKNILKFAKGRCIDFGCGTGDLLRLLPPGSIGVDINRASIEYCVKNKLVANTYIIEEDNYELKCFGENKYDTMIFSHILEHIEDSKEKIKTLFASAERLGLKKIIIVVPGIKGFRYDETHRTYIDMEYINKNGMRELSGFEIIHSKYFPFNSKKISKYFTHNELVIVYEKKK